MENPDEIKINEEEQLSKESSEALSKGANFFAVRTTAGQELNVLLMLEVRIRTLNLPIYAVFSLPNMKGYIVVEAPGLHIVYEAIRGLKHVKGKASGTVKWGDIESLLKPKSLIELLKEGEEVEIIAGPFRGMKARVVAVDKVKNEVSLSVLEASYPLTITIPVDYIRPTKRGE
uniref:Transcription elongation factor Spt5 n=1 Tax=Ignisphaera aggregans TaxID=334771 RepID=A0A7C4BCJ5_9CREN